MVFNSPDPDVLNQTQITTNKTKEDTFNLVEAADMVFISEPFRSFLLAVG